MFVIPDVCVYNYPGGSIVNQHINNIDVLIDNTTSQIVGYGS
jgi:hypothetical protein